MSRYLIFVRGGGPKNDRNLNVAREVVVARCAARRRELTQCSSSLLRDVNLGYCCCGLFSKYL
jgi:hypothetical protein